MTKNSNISEMTSLIRIKIQGIFTSILIDSGAARSSVDLDFAKRLGVSIKDLEVGQIKELSSPVPNVSVLGLVRSENQNTHLIELINKGQQPLSLKSFGPIAIL